MVRCGASWACSPRPRLDYGLDILGIKETGTPVPIWYPVRLLGTVAGLMLVYGTTVMIIDRVRRREPSVARSATADWTLLALLWITGVTGFGLELALYLPEPPAWGYWVFLFHVAVAMELVLLAPFMKLAHAVYRPVALFFVALAREPREGTGGIEWLTDSAEEVPMTPTLPRVAHEHHERLMQHVDEMPAVGKMLLTAPIGGAEAAPGGAGRLAHRAPDPAPGGRRGHPLPGAGADAPEPALDGAHAPRARGDPAPGRRVLAPPRRPSATSDPTSARWSPCGASCSSLYALLEIHLVEEEVFIPIVNHGVTDEAAEVMAAALKHSGIPEA